VEESQQHHNGAQKKHGFHENIGKCQITQHKIDARVQAFVANIRQHNQTIHADQNNGATKLHRHPHHNIGELQLFCGRQSRRRIDLRHEIAKSYVVVDQIHL
jgi:hypothetical protein